MTFSGRSNFLRQTVTHGATKLTTFVTYIQVYQIPSLVNFDALWSLLRVGGTDLLQLLESKSSFKLAYPRRSGFKLGNDYPKNSGSSLYSQWMKLGWNWVSVRWSCISLYYCFVLYKVLYLKDVSLQKRRNFTSPAHDAKRIKTPVPGIWCQVEFFVEILLEVVVI